MRKKCLLPFILALALAGCSGQGSKEPAVTPTSAPSEAPADQPTEAPAEEVTATPTVIPAVENTEAPTEAPVETPTEAPEEAPTEAPEETPTEAPGETPTEAPEEAPTKAPEEVPSEAPTEAPEQPPAEAPSEGDWREGRDLHQAAFNMGGAHVPVLYEIVGARIDLYHDSSEQALFDSIELPYGMTDSERLAETFETSDFDEDEYGDISLGTLDEYGAALWYLFRWNDDAGHFEFYDCYYEEGGEDDFDQVGWAIDEAISIINEDRHTGDESADAYRPPENWKALSEDQLAVYRELEEKVSSFEPFTYEVEEYGYDYLNTIYAVLPTLSDDRMDIDVYFMTDEVFDEEGRQTALKSRYIYPYDSDFSAENDLEGLREAVASFEDAADRIVAEMPSDYSDYDKYRYFATVISLQTTYDYYGNGGYQVGNAYGAIYGGWSICQGYSTGFKYLCSKAGLYCSRVSGLCPGDGDNMSHMWNKVRLDGQDYYIDVTWCDGDDNYPGSEAWKTYFMVSREFLEEEADHVFETMEE